MYIYILISRSINLCSISHIDSYMFFKNHHALFDVLDPLSIDPHPNFIPPASNPRRSRKSQGLAEGDAAGDATVTSSR